MNDQNRVVVAMSGGVDSSVAAALLQQQGYEVIGMMLRLWSEPGSETSNRCCTPDAMALARRVAARLGIPFYAVDARQVFYDHVVAYFLDGYSQGITPNPCLECNRQVRWDFLLKNALTIGAGSLATGHYARLHKDEDGRFHLSRAVDTAKDQSYVLHVITQEKLQHALFPLGGYTKPQVRQIARDLDLPVAERAESQDLCFLADKSLPEFLVRQTPQVEQPGPILTRAGEQIGTHRGLAFYTIGQRKGLYISNRWPLYVLEKDRQRNALVVGPLEQLGQSELTAGKVNWVSGQAPEGAFRAQVKIRYKARESWGWVTPLEDGRLHIRFEEPMRDITPGQAAVVYLEDECIGGGVIEG